MRQCVTMAMMHDVTKLIVQHLSGLAGTYSTHGRLRRNDALMVAHFINLIPHCLFRALLLYGKPIAEPPLLKGHSYDAFQIKHHKKCDTLHKSMQKVWSHDRVTLYACWFNECWSGMTREDSGQKGKQWLSSFWETTVTVAPKWIGSHVGDPCNS